MQATIKVSIPTFNNDPCNSSHAQQSTLLFLAADQEQYPWRCPYRRDHTSQGFRGVGRPPILESKMSVSVTNVPVMHGEPYPCQTHSRAVSQVGKFRHTPTAKYRRRLRRYGSYPLPHQ